MSLTGRALWVIERNLDCDLDLAGLAMACDVSRFHLAHAFGEATGRSVMDYIRGRRLTKAALALAAGAKDILAIALDSGYASHEAFTGAFGAQFGRTPEEVRSAGSVCNLALVDAIRLEAPSPGDPVAPRCERAGEFRFVGLSERRSYGAAEQIPAQWQRFMSNFYSGIDYRIGTIPVGISTSGADGQLVYVCAAEVDRFGEIPEGLVKVTLAPACYAVFAHDGHVNTLRRTYAAIWNDWFPASGKKPAEAPSIERHNRTFDPRTGKGGLTIWIPIAA